MSEKSSNPFKMKEFSYYEFTGLLVPGGVFTAGILVLFPKCAPFVATGGLGFGEFGLLLRFILTGSRRETVCPTPARHPHARFAQDAKTPRRQGFLAMPSQPQPLSPLRLCVFA